jgi:NCS1 family nucleobase:cation symporter-1
MGIGVLAALIFSGISWYASLLPAGISYYLLMQYMPAARRFRD